MPFGARTRPFPNKKAAKTNAAREAVLWLVEQGDMSRTAEGTYAILTTNNNSGGKKKKSKSGAAIVATESSAGNGNGSAQGAAAGGGERKEVSFAARVNGTFAPLPLSTPETPSHLPNPTGPKHS